MPPKIQKNLSPVSAPSYAQGSVPGIKGQATAGDYRGRLARIAPPPKKKKLPKVAPVVPKVNTGNVADNEEYQDLIAKYKGNLAKQRETAMNLYKRNKGALETDLNTTRESITKQRGADLNDITEQYAARGIGRSSGVYQQAGVDYETAVQDRLKNAEKTYQQQLAQENASQAEATTEADAEYQEGLAEAAKRKTAANAEAKASAPKPKAKPLPSPIAPKKKQPKFELAPSKGKLR